MISNDLDYFIEEAEKHPTKPYCLHNMELAIDLSKALRYKHPFHKVIFTDVGQHICLTKTAMEKVKKLYKKRANEVFAHYMELDKTLDEIERKLLVMGDEKNEQ